MLIKFWLTTPAPYLVRRGEIRRLTSKINKYLLNKKGIVPISTNREKV